MQSLWTDTVKMPVFAPLHGELKTDVLVIGGGITGILCAHQLKEAGVDYALVEANRLCSGITGDTTAKITVQHGLIYDKLIRRFGEETARFYWAINQLALQQYERMTQSIDCCFQNQDSVVYSKYNREKLEKECRALERIGVSYDWMEKTSLPFSVVGAIRMKQQAQFHPLRFLAHIAQNLNVYECTTVREWKGHRFTTDHGSIAAKKVIVATHFPMFNKHGSYYLKLYQHRSYVLALEKAQKVDGMYVDESQTGLSFRNHQGLLLLGGGGHRTGKQGGNWTELSEFAQKYYPQANTAYRWATQDCMSLDGVPYIGQYSANTPDLYVATGFHKWGMTTAMAAAMILCDLVQERESPYAQVFSPSRSILRPQLAVNGMESMIHLLSFSKRRCPHMGCALKWNQQEHSWDCPCHGSRFTADGKLIDNPATGHLKGAGK